MKTTRSALGRLLAVIGLAFVALMSTGAAALPDLSATERVVVDFDMEDGEYEAIREAAVDANALVFVSSDLSAYGDLDLVLHEVERRWAQDTKHAPKVLVLDVATNTLWPTDTSKPTYCAADASAADCVTELGNGARGLGMMLVFGILALVGVFWLVTLIVYYFRY